MSDEILDESVDDGDDGDALVEVPRRGKLALATAVVLALVAIPLVWVLATGGDSTDRAAGTHLQGREVPRVAGNSLLDDASFDVAEEEGSWVVVNFFATWCPPCVREHPELVALHEAYKDTGEVSVVSVVYNDDLDEVKAFFERNGGEWPVISDAGETIPVEFGVTGVPETYIVDPFGVVQRKLIGGVTRAGIETEIAEISTELEAELTDDRGGDAP